MAIPRLHVKEPIPAPVSSGGSSIRTVNIGDLVYVDRDGNVATILSETVFIILQNAAGFTWALNFILYNKTHDIPGPHETGFGAVYIRFLDANGKYVAPNLEAVFTRRDCLNQGPKTVGGALNDIFQEGAVTFEMTQKEVTADIGVC
jgi:hypothetical protein